MLPPPPKNLKPGRQKTISRSPQRAYGGLCLRKRPDENNAQLRSLAFVDQWRLNRPIPEIATAIGISERSAWRWQNNLRKYGSIRRPTQIPLGRPHKLSVADEKALLHELRNTGWMYQDEMIQWLAHERNVTVSQATVSSLLKANQWTSKTLSLQSDRQDDALRTAYVQDMRKFAADDLIFLDESLFNEKTGWRSRGYAPIGSLARYRANINRGQTYSILPALDIDGYLPCTGIKKGYFNREEFMDWIKNDLLPAISEKYGPRPMVVVLDNVSIHIATEIIDLIENAGHIVKYLPPYSPDYNPIELTFAVLKRWMRRHYFTVRSEYSNFENFLRMAIRDSHCDRFALKQYTHAAHGSYILRDDWEALQAQIRVFLQGNIPGLSREVEVMM
jgi:transposase